LMPLAYVCRVVQNRMPIHILHDCIFGDFPAKKTVYTPYVYICTHRICIYGSGQPYRFGTFVLAWLLVFCPHSTLSFSSVRRNCMNFTIEFYILSIVCYILQVTRCVQCSHTLFSNKDGTITSVWSKQGCKKGALKTVTRL